MAVKKTRLHAEIQLAYGDRLLQQVSRRKIVAIDDKLERATGFNHFAVATGTTDMEIDFATQGGADSARFLFIQSDQEISVKLNDAANTALYVSPQTEDPFGQVLDPDLVLDGFLVLKTKSINKVFISNASGSPANVLIFAGALAA